MVDTEEVVEVDLEVIEVSFNYLFCNMYNIFFDS